jgi:hypothetical protein
MKRMRLLILVFAVTILVQCSKDKNDNAANLTKGLLAVFKMNNDLKDSTGNIPLGYYSSTGIKAVADRKGNAKSAMFFDEGAMTAIVEDWSANPITVSCWVRPKYNTNQNYFLQSDEGGVFGFYQDKDNIGFIISTPTTYGAMTGLDTGWIHIVGTYDGKDVRTYINGQLKKTVQHPGDPVSIGSFKLGSFAVPWWKGTIDDLRFYNRLLSEEEIALLASL